jgi:tetratricopeptide (TPR) repeat protein
MHSPRAPLRRDTRVFISAVSRELGTVRQLVKKALEDSGYHAVEQTTFPLDYRDVVDKLRLLLASCDAVIHIAGQYFGAEPPQQPAGTTHRSYTQLEYALACELGKPVYVFITDDAFPTDPHTAEEEEHSRLQAEHRQALMQTGQDYCLALSREDIDQKVRSLHLQREILTEELTRTDDRVVATGRRLGRRSALILVLVLAILGTLGYVVWRGEQQRQQAHNVAQVTKGIAERFLDNLLTNKDISAEEARRRALAELPAMVGLPADVIRQLIEGKIAARVQDTLLSPLERARAALAVGNYEAVFIESAKQRVESRELAILEGTAALARFQDNPQFSWQTKALAAFQRALALPEAITQPVEWAHAVLLVGCVLANLARFAEAEPIVRHALQLLESQYGPEHPEAAMTLHILAILLQATNRLTEAERLMRQALTIDEQSYGPMHPKVAIVLNDLVRLLQATNRLAEAEPLVQRALTIDEQSFGPMDPKVAVDLNDLAVLLWNTNRLAEAEPLMRRAVRIFVDFTRNTGHEHPHQDVCTTNYVRLLHALGRSEAEIHEALEALKAEPR